MLKYSVVMYFLLYLFSPSSAYTATEAIIVVDPGHSQLHQGAISCSGRGESGYNQILSRRIIETLNAAGNKSILTTTGQDSPLIQRAAIAKQNDIIISVHHDSVQLQFITISRSGTKRSYCSQKAKGFSIFVSRLNPQYEKSLKLAKILGAALVNRGISPSLHHSEHVSGENRVLIDGKNGIYLFDELTILKTALSPAILLEAAVIVHPDDDRRAQMIDYQQDIANAINEMTQYSNN